jgi:hypothetical protein
MGAPGGGNGARDEESCDGPATRVAGAVARHLVSGFHELQSRPYTCVIRGRCRQEQQEAVGVRGVERHAKTTQYVELNIKEVLGYIF